MSDKPKKKKSKKGTRSEKEPIKKGGESKWEEFLRRHRTTREKK